jgi:hypothetical protein
VLDLLFLNLENTVPVILLGDLNVGLGLALLVPVVKSRTLR